MDCLIKEEDISVLFRNGKILNTIFKETKEIVKPGVTPLKIDSFMNRRMIDFEVRPATLGYKGPNGIIYKHSSCISVNDMVVHGVPNNIPLKEGDILSIDSAIEKDGLYVDKCINVMVGNVSEESYRIVSATEQALEFAIQKVAVDKKIGDISCVIDKTIRSFGFETSPNFVGHGIGYKFHTYPEVPNQGAEDTGPNLIAGMCIAIEPIAIAGKHKVFLKDDGWSVQNLGGLSSHCEDTVYVSEKGPIVVTRL